MKTTTLQCVTTEICGRKLDPVLEAYLPEYIQELTILLQLIHEDSLTIPLELEPVSVFSLTQVKQCNP